jgi:ABC-type nitrate/sulfonate/bicarbonate transport system permease component
VLLGTMDGRVKPGHDETRGSIDSLRVRSAVTKDALGSRMIQAGFVVALVALWYYATDVAGINAIFVPKIAAVWRELAKIVTSGAILEPLRVTLASVATAYCIAAAAGIVAGYLVTRSTYLVRLIEPVLAGMFAVPITLFFPLFILYFGIGVQSKIAYGATYAFFPIALNTIAGFAGVDRKLIDAARSMGASGFDLFRHVLYPAAFPVVLTGLRIGFFICFAAVLGGETITSEKGLGKQIAVAAELMESARMFAWIALVVTISMTLNLLVSRIERQRHEDGR